MSVKTAWHKDTVLVSRRPSFKYEQSLRLGKVGPTALRRSIDHLWQTGRQYVGPAPLSLSKFMVISTVSNQLGAAHPVLSPSSREVASILSEVGNNF